MTQGWRILIGLALGLGLGMLAGGRGLALASAIGGLWLDALKMTIVPLVVALLVRGIAGTAETARGSGLALRAVGLFVALLGLSAGLAALLMPGLLGLWPLGGDTAAALKAGLGGAMVTAPAGTDILGALVPDNPVAAAAGSQMLPLILFTGLFAVALTRLPAERAAPVITFFGTVADAMLVIVGWVLWLAPLGVAALGYGLGANVGVAAVGALAHYIVIVSLVGMVIWLLAVPLAVLAGRVRPGAFATAMAPVLAVALSTQSSLASLPSMLKASERLGVPTQVAGVTLPMAVAIFRVTGPAMNLAVVLYVAHWLGLETSPLALGAGVAVATLTSLASVSLPGQVSFIAAIAPIALVMGVPLEPLALLVAVEMLPDLVRTGSNVTMDVATTLALGRRETD
jgi:Na+/H+-dicarboxylate symporter